MTETAATGPSRSRLRVRTLLALVACCAAVLWSWRVVSDAGPLEATVRQLHAADPRERLSAAETLGRSPPNEAGAAVDALLDALGDPDDDVRASAAHALGTLQAAALNGAAPDLATVRGVARALLDALGTSGPKARAGASQGLGLIVRARPPGAPALLPPEDFRAVEQGLVGRLGDDTAEVRAAATVGLDGLAWRSNSPPPEALFAAVERDPSPDVRILAARALGGYREGFDRVAVALARGVVSADPKQSLACEYGLRTALLARGNHARPPSEAFDTLTGALAGPDPKGRETAARVLGEFGPGAVDAVDRLLKTLREPYRPAGSPVPEFFSRRDGSPTAAAEALGRIAPGTPRAGEVVAALTDAIRRDGPHPPGLVETCVLALGKFGPGVAPALLAVLKADPGFEGDPAQLAAPILGGFGPDTPEAAEAVPILAAALGSRNGVTRAVAARSLGAFGRASAGALDRLRALARDDPDDMARDAADEAARKVEAAVGK